MKLLGFNCFMNDAAAALVVDGLPVAAAEEERFVRRKHTGEFPRRALEWVLASQGTAADELDGVTFAMRPWLGLPRRLAQIARWLPGSLRVSRNQGAKWWRMTRVRSMFAAATRARGARRRPPFHFLPHHLCHAASGFYPSPFEEAAILVWDGSGEIASTMLAHGRDRSIEVLHTVDFPHSAGYLYSAFTDFLGFRVHGGEGKVMGLAAYGDERFFATVDEMVRLEPGGGFRLDLSWFDFQRGGTRFFGRKMVERFGPPRRPEGPITPRDMALAAAVQHATERIGFHLVAELVARTGCRNLVIAGGVGLNGDFNGKILSHTPCTGLYVPPAAHDAGTALGGPLYLHHHVHGRPRERWTNHALLGPEYDESEALAALGRAGIPWQRVADPAADAAQALAAGDVVGWFQGRMEFGPRALGNRSILADPRRAEMKDVVNRRVKRREDFRPFAPAILAERQGEYFTCAAPAPHMLQIYPVREEKRKEIPAVVHVDGTGRVQSVDGAENPLFRRLIEAFAALTGVPVVLNSSFNVRGEPIVCTPDEAIRCYLGTDMDRLYVGNLRLAKRG